MPKWVSGKNHGHQNEVNAKGTCDQSWSGFHSPADQELTPDYAEVPHLVCSAKPRNAADTAPEPMNV